jgi:hypothetical protein
MLRKLPTVHHAVHLANLRDVCAKSPTKLLKDYSPTTAATEKKLSNSAAPKKNASAPSGSSSSSAGKDEIDLANFADIDRVGASLEAAEARAVFDEFNGAGGVAEVGGGAGGTAGLGEGGGGGKKRWKSMFSSGSSSDGRDKSAYTK